MDGAYVSIKGGLTLENQHRKDTPFQQVCRDSTRGSDTDERQIEIVGEEIEFVGGVKVNT